MTTSNSQKLICSKGLKKDRSATEALKRCQLASRYGIDHKEIQ